MPIAKLTIPYPDFKYDEIINSEAFDLNNESIKEKVNEIIDNTYDKTSADARYIAGAGQRVEIVPVFFFTNGSSKEATGSVTFSKAFTAPPSVFPGRVTQSVPYSDVLNYPYIYNVSLTGFSVKLTSTGNLGTFGVPANLIMDFMAVGK